MGAIHKSQDDIYCPETATLLESDSMTAQEHFFKFRLDSGKELGHMPGQFVEVSVAGMGEAPISISSSPTQKGSFELIVRKVGNVSGALHRLEVGAKAGIRGPFGTHFPVDGDMKGKDIVFICGGIGSVPVRSAINYVLHNRKDYGHVTILFGSKSPADRLFVDEIEKWKTQPDVDFEETLDRGDATWKGNVGVITTLMPKISFQTDCTKVIVCGPPIMYKFVIMELQKMGFKHEDIYISLERHMKCGVGKCGHCQINGLYVCQDGPVFKYADVAEVKEAI